MSNQPAKQEFRAARMLSGRRVKASGAGVEKGDASAQASLRDNWMIECKQTVGSYVSFQLMWWQKLLYDANAELKRPLCHLECPGVSVYVIATNDLEELVSKSPITKILVVRKPVNLKSFRLEARQWLSFQREAQTNMLCFWTFRLGGFSLNVVSESDFVKLFSIFQEAHHGEAEAPSNQINTG